MTIKLTNLRRPVERPEDELPDEIADALGVAPDDVVRWNILRRSIDARSRRDIQYVHTLAVDVRDESAVAKSSDVTPYTPPVFDDPPAHPERLEHRPVVVGSGPAGLLAAYYLANKGFQPLVLERGYPVKERVPAIRRFDSGGPLEGDNNYLFGEGGAGCFSDGKLTCRMTGPDVDYVLRAFVDCGGRDSIVYEHRPHLGSNKLPMISRNFRRKIETAGGEYRFGCNVIGLRVENDQVTGVETSQGFIATNHVIFGIGHSARDTYEWLHELGVPMVPKAFQLGLRIEQPQENVNNWKYGRDEYVELLGAADYAIVAKDRKKKVRDLYSFCMCAGGWIIPSISEPGRFCTNGMSNSRHDTDYANSGLMVTLDPSEFGDVLARIGSAASGSHPLAGVEIQRHYERIAYEASRDSFLAPQQSAADFLSGRTPATATRTSYPRGGVPIDLQSVLPPSVGQAIRLQLPNMDTKWRGQFLADAVLHGPEMRGSSPLRIDRDRDTRATPGFTGLYPVGEGAGYAGGIVSAAVDGLRSARAACRCPEGNAVARR